MTTSAKEIEAKRTLLLIHWFLCSIGLAGIVYGLSWKLHAALLAARPITKYSEWAVPFFYPNKPQQLIFFIAAGFSLFLYYILVYFLTTKRGEFLSASYSMADLRSKGFLLIYIGIPISVNTIVAAGFPSGASPSIPLSGYVLMVLWLSAVLLPFYPRFDQVKEKFQQVKKKFSHVTERTNQYLQGWVYLWFVAGLVVLSCVQLFTIFLPFLRGELLMMNEYLDVPEYTWLDDKYVSNSEYINNHSLGGLLKYDPEADHGASPLPRQGTFVELPKTELLVLFIEQNKTKYSYDEVLHALVIHGAMTSDERKELYAIVDNEHSTKIIALYYRSREHNEWLKNRVFTSEELEFLRKNRLEMHWQILNRWVIHHHNFVLGPISEYALGKPLQDINVQYGSFNVVLMRYFLEKTGGITFQNYLQKWYTFWPLYYILFVALAFLVFRDVYYVALVCLLAFGFVNKIDYQFLFLGPGLNPIRHFFDIPVIACLFFYLKSHKTTFLVFGFLLGLIGIVNNTQFGLLLVLALSATVVVKKILETEAILYRDLGWVTVALTTAGTILMVGDLGKDDIATQYIKGWFGFPVHARQLFFIMLVISGCYLVLLRLYKATSELKYIALFLLFYSQGVLVYYIWGGTEKHLFNVASILILCGVTFIKLVIDYSSVKHFKRLLIGSLLAVALIVVYIPGLLSYYITRQEYENIFLTHRTYDWNLETAKFRSTMDPKYFVDSISLIQAYAPSGNAIYLISKYDNFLPFLAKKYSAMPFFDLQWFLLTSKEVQLCIERIKTQKPHYLFVDTDIERDFNGEIVTAGFGFISGPAGESLMRVQRLNLLKDIFAAVKEDYESVKQGMLITVYKRKFTEGKQAVTDTTLFN